MLPEVARPILLPHANNSGNMGNQRGCVCTKACAAIRQNKIKLQHMQNKIENFAQ